MKHVLLLTFYLFTFSLSSQDTVNVDFKISDLGIGCIPIDSFTLLTDDLPEHIQETIVSHYRKLPYGGDEISWVTLPYETAMEDSVTIESVRPIAYIRTTNRVILVVDDIDQKVLPFDRYELTKIGSNVKGYDYFDGNPDLDNASIYRLRIWLMDSHIYDGEVIIYENHPNSEKAKNFNILHEYLLLDSQ